MKLLILALLLITGCVTQVSTSSPDVDRLRAQADALATSEITRFNSAEQIYKSAPEFFPRVMMDGSGNWLKFMRRWDSATLIDIVRTESILYPYSITLQFNYTLLRTDMHGSEEYNAEAVVLADTVWRSYARLIHTLTYPLTTEGTSPMQSVPYRDRSIVILGAASIEDIL